MNNGGGSSRFGQSSSGTAPPLTLKVQSHSAGRVAFPSVLMHEFAEARPLRCVPLMRVERGVVCQTGSALLDFATSEDTVAAYYKARKLGMEAQYLSFDERAREMSAQPPPQNQPPHVYYNAPPQQQRLQLPQPQLPRSSLLLPHADDDVDDLVRTDTLRTRVIVLVDAQMCWDEAFAHEELCAPVELCAMSFTAAGGRIGTFHRIISPGRVPAPVSDSAWWFTARVHGIPADYPDAEKHYGQLWADLCAFLRDAAEHSPTNPETRRPHSLLLVSEHPRAANRCFAWMMRIAGASAGPDAPTPMRVPSVRSAEELYAAFLRAQPGLDSDARKRRANGLAVLLGRPLPLEEMCKYHQTMNDPNVEQPQVVGPLSVSSTIESLTGRVERINYQCSRAIVYQMYNTFTECITPVSVASGASNPASPTASAQRRY